MHDLARVGSVTVARLALPVWACASLERAPWVVVRRSGACEGVAVGVRGSTRGERFATVIAASEILALRRPEDLVAAARSSAGPLADAARCLDDAARACGLQWGPTGSYGFELASRTPATNAASDLDCLVRGTATAPAALLAFAQACSEIASAAPTRIDVEITFDSIGIALADYASGARRIAAKTPAGPVLLDRESLACRA